jgi:hypothetical protein
MSVYNGIQLSSATVSAPLNILIPGPAPIGYALGLICTVTPGATLNYSVQVTADPTPSANGFWNNHDILASLTASANSNIAYPVTGVRLNIGSYSSGTVNLGVASWP